MGEILPVDHTLLDKDGVPHRYECTPFAFDEAFDLGLELADLIGGSVGEALKGLFLGNDLDPEKIDEGAIGEALVGLTGVPKRILKAGGSELLARILANTWRASNAAGLKGSPGRLIRQNLRDPDARTQAYSGGNIRECLEAVAFVLEVNYGPFLTDLWQMLQPYLEGFAANKLGIGLEEEIPENANGGIENGEQKPVEIG